MLAAEDVKVGLADGLGGVAEPEAPRHGQVDANEAALPILEIDVIGYRIGQLPEQPLLPSQVLLRPLARGDVLQRPFVVLLPLFVVHDLDVGQDPDRGAVLAAHLDLEAHDISGLLQLALHLDAPGVVDVDARHVGHLAHESVRRLVAEDSSQRGIGGQDRPIGLRQ